MRFVLEMRQAGVTDARVLAAMERTPRGLFAPVHLEALALDDVALPLANGQFMTKPSLIGAMLAALDPQAGDCVLEVGAGSGYQSAVLAQMARRVVAIDANADLVAAARQNLGRARVMNAYVHVSGAADGWPLEAPYERIIVNGALPEIPEALLAQLKADGALLAPVGEGKTQRLIRCRFGAREDLGPIAFAPLQRPAPPVVAPDPDSP